MQAPLFNRIKYKYYSRHIQEGGELRRCSYELYSSNESLMQAKQKFLGYLFTWSGIPEGVNIEKTPKREGMTYSAEL